MGQAIARGLDAAGIYAASEIILYDVNEESLRQVVKFQTAKSIDKLIQKLDVDGVLLFAVKPQNMEEVLDACSELRDSVIVVSIAAGAKIAKLEKFLPLNPIIRVMPNTPAQIAKGASVLAANDKCSAEQIDQIRKIFSSLGLAIVLDESKLDAVTALSGSGPAYVFRLIEAMTEAGVKLGLELEASKALARQTVYGAACLVMETGSEAADLRKQVTSPNGTTQAALESLAANDFENIIYEAIAAAAKRSAELS